MDAGTPKKTGAGDRHNRPAMRDLSAHLCFWGLAGGTLWLDLWSKHWSFSSLGPNELRPILAGAIDFRRSFNDGAVFGSFAGYPGVFILASVAALGVVLYMFAHSVRTQRSLHIALALILAGALGNLYDRAFVIADVVKFTNSAGREVSVIGQDLNDPDDPMIRLADWPGGTNEQLFRRSEVTTARQGVVRDFIKFVWKFPAWFPKLGGREVWPWVFNVADSALVCGVGILLLHVWLDRKPRASRG